MSEWRFDKLQARLQGTFQVALGYRDAWIGRLFDTHGHPPLHFFCNHRSASAGKLTATLRDRLFTISGTLSIAAGHAPIGSQLVTLELKLNPTRTFAHLGCPPLESAEQLEPEVFFQSNRQMEELLRIDALDNNDNYSPVETAISSFPGGRGWTRWLAIYEQKLRSLCELMFQDQTQPPSARGPPPSSNVQGGLRWDDISLSAAEAYIERFSFRAVGTGHSIGRSLEAIASEVYTDVFPPRVTARRERREAALMASVPLTQKISVCVYAKTETRVRFELRYHRSHVASARSVGDAVASGMAAGSLTAKLQFIAGDALERLLPVWAALCRAQSGNDHLDPCGALGELADEVRKACCDCPDHFRYIFGRLLRVGALTPNEESIQLPKSVTRALLRAGVLERYRLRSEPRGRRGSLSLSPRFLAARAAAGLERSPDRELATSPATVHQVREPSRVWPSELQPVASGQRPNPA